MSQYQPGPNWLVSHVRGTHALTFLQLKFATATGLLIFPGGTITAPPYSGTIGLNVNNLSLVLNPAAGAADIVPLAFYRADQNEIYEVNALISQDGDSTAPPPVNSFGVVVAGGSSVVAEQAGDTLNLVAGAGIVLSADGPADAVTISATAAALAASFGTVRVTGQADVVADAPGGVLTMAGANGITLQTSGGVVTISRPPAFGLITVAGQPNVVPTPAGSITLQLVAGSGIVITTVPDSAAVIISAPPPAAPVFGQDFFQHNAPGMPFTFSAEGVWTTVDVLTRTFVAGTYTFDAVAVYGADQTSKQVAVRVLLDGTPVGPDVNRELKDAADRIDFSTVVTMPMTAGSHSITLQMQQFTGAGVDDVTCYAWRLRGFRVA